MLLFYHKMHIFSDQIEICAYSVTTKRQQITHTLGYIYIAKYNTLQELIDHMIYVHGDEDELFHCGRSR